MRRAVEAGAQAALMAPTEVLANQHHATLSRLSPVPVALVTGSTKGRARRASLGCIADGSVPIAVGTHALFSPDVGFRDLGLAVIDEQHRFGVEQRALLKDLGRETGSGDEPDVLVMTATPIPRTAAMLVYGDLDQTELRKMPPGRIPVETIVIGPDPMLRAAAYERVLHEVAAGRQAYVVCSLVEGSPKIEAKAATEELERLQELLELDDAPARLTRLRLRGAAHGCLTEVDEIVAQMLEWLDRQGIRGR